MNTITFIDSIGRNIMGEELARTDSTISVKNPAMINVAQAQNGQLQVQLIPLFFAEFIDSSTRTEGSTWNFNLNQITIGTVNIDGRLLEQYVRVASNQPVTETTQPDSENVVKLFDE